MAKNRETNAGPIVDTVNENGSTAIAAVDLKSAIKSPYPRRQRTFGPSRTYTPPARKGHQCLSLEYFLFLLKSPLL